MNEIKVNDVVIVEASETGNWNGVLCVVDAVKDKCIRVRMREPHKDWDYYANIMPEQLRKVGEL